MGDLKVITYEESRLEYFRKQRDSAERRMNYWCSAKQADRVEYWIPFSLIPKPTKEVDIE
mgnify:CR=1 FL=1